MKTFLLFLFTATLAFAQVTPGAGSLAGNSVVTPASATTPTFTGNITDNIAATNIFTTGQSAAGANTILGVNNTGAGGKLWQLISTNSSSALTQGAFVIFDGTDGAQIAAFTQTGVLFGTKITNYNGVATAGNGVSVVVAAPRQTAVTNTTATLATYTVPAADTTYRVSANVQVTAATTAAMTVVCTYTDETNTSRAQTIPFCQLAGTFLTSITNVTGIGPYEGATIEIRCKASTTIVFTTAGTVTGITYNVQGTVTQEN